MYGLINVALKDMINEHYGEDKWLEVLAESAVENDSFLSMRSYHDNVTYALIRAASRVLGLSPDDCLKMFGEYWVLKTATNSYPMLMDMAGDNLIDFLQNLDDLHDHITSTFKDYSPPSFRIEKLGADHHRLHYISQRVGLDAFVIGLLKGLAIRFDTNITFRSQSSEPIILGTHTIFDIEISKQ